MRLGSFEGRGTVSVRKSFQTLYGVALTVVFVAGCADKNEPTDYARPLPPGAHALRKLTDPEMFPDFAAGFSQDSEALVAAVDYSLDYLAHPSSVNYFPIQEITHQRVVESLQAFRTLVLSCASPEEFERRVLQRFDVYQSVGCDGRGTVLFTGYYQPILDGSLEPTEEFRYPLFMLPGDLVKDEEGRCLGRRTPDGRLMPYPTRRELETGSLLDGLELVYLKDPFDAYLCHVQGSAKIRLPDGGFFEVGYAGKNGRPYTSVSQLLIEDGKIDPAKRSLATVQQYFREHPGDTEYYCRQNESFIFFHEAGGGPRGSLNVPVTPYRSLATDKSVFPRGALTYVMTHVPARRGKVLVGEPFRQFMLDQDTGGAIRAAGRADIYLGIGHQAGQIAGWTVNEGKLYYLLLKSDDPSVATVAP